MANETIKEYDSDGFNTYAVEVDLVCGNFTGFLRTNVHGNITGFDVLESAVDSLEDDLYEDEIILTNPDGETLSIIPADLGGLEQYVVSVRIVRVTPDAD